MSYMDWDARLETGIASVDAQHRSLVDTLNRLHDAMKQGKAKGEVQGILTFLAEYTIKHFAEEEAQMQRHGYPAFARHKGIHEDLLKRVKDLLDTVAKGEVVLSLDLMDFLQDWLSKHILREDMAYATYYKEKGIKI